MKTVALLIMIFILNTPFSMNWGGVILGETKPIRIVMSHHVVDRGLVRRTLDWVAVTFH